MLHKEIILLFFFYNLFLFTFSHQNLHICFQYFVHCFKTNNHVSCNNTLLKKQKIRYNYFIFLHDTYQEDYMSNLAIIAEYNPFHNGHLYQLNAALDITGADFSVAIMSGNFIQRGIPAIAEKYRRAEIAISCGIDLVLELPYVYATASAKDFATAAITMLNKIAQIDYLAFGVEDDNLDLLSKISEVLVTEPETFSNELKVKLASGMSYPAARATALNSYFKEDDISAIISQPNNILALEYLCALKQTHSKIQPVPIKRIQSQYNAIDISSDICSATAIREHLRIENNSIMGIKNQVPAESYNVLHSIYNTYGPIFEDDFSDLLQYQMLLNQTCKGSYPDTSDMSEELYHRLLKLSHNESFRKTADGLKTKNQTYTRINRALLHYISKLSSEDMNRFKTDGYIYYANILACKKNSTSLLRTLSGTSEIPFITKIADAKNILTPFAMEMFQYDLLADSLYANAVYKKYEYRLPNAYQTRPYIG